MRGDAGHLWAKPAGCVWAKWYAYQHWRWQAEGILEVTRNCDDGLMKCSILIFWGSLEKCRCSLFFPSLVRLGHREYKLKRKKHEHEASKSWEASFDKCGFSNLLSSVKAELVFVRDTVTGEDCVKYFPLTFHIPKLGWQCPSCLGSRVCFHGNCKIRA